MMNSTVRRHESDGLELRSHDRFRRAMSRASELIRVIKLDKGSLLADEPYVIRFRKFSLPLILR